VLTESGSAAATPILQVDCGQRGASQVNGYGREARCRAEWREAVLADLTRIDERFHQTLFRYLDKQPSGSPRSEGVPSDRPQLPAPEASSSS
jgi:hypothetical protein